MAPRRPRCGPRIVASLLVASLRSASGGGGRSGTRGHPQHPLAAASGCPGGRANVMDFGADPSGTNDSAPAFRAALAACQSLYAPAGTYALKTPEPSGRLPTAAAAAAAAALPPPPAAEEAAAGGFCPSDGRNCIVANCTCPPGDGPP